MKSWRRVARVLAVPKLRKFKTPRNLAILTFQNSLQLVKFLSPSPPLPPFRTFSSTIARYFEHQSAPNNKVTFIKGMHFRSSAYRTPFRAKSPRKQRTTFFLPDYLTFYLITRESSNHPRTPRFSSSSSRFSFARNKPQQTDSTPPLSTAPSPRRGL